jgi:glycerophosphoryl diester phosphodiesterase
MRRFFGSHPVQIVVLVLAGAVVALPMVFDPPCGELCGDPVERNPFFGPEGTFVAVSHEGIKQDGEISTAGFVAAYELGYRYMETDLRLTTDRELIAVHALTNLEDGRYTRADGPTADELVGHKGLSDARWNFEFSAPDHRHITAFRKLLERHPWLEQRVCVHFGRTLDGRKIEEFRDAFPGLCTCASFVERSELGDMAAARWLSHWLNRGGDDPPAYSCAVIADVFADPADLDDIREGLVVMSWPLANESEERLSELVDAGFGGIMTNEPCRLKQVLVERGRWVEPTDPDS